MKRRQYQFIENMELAVARLVHGGHKEDAEALGKVVEDMHNGNYVAAIRNAIDANLPDWYIAKMRKLFSNRKSANG